MVTRAVWDQGGTKVGPRWDGVRVDEKLGTLNGGHIHTEHQAGGGVGGGELIRCTSQDGNVSFLQCPRP